MRKARPVRAIIAQVVSPTREPNWTKSAELNPRAAPRRTVSAVTTPGGAQKAIARTNEDRKSVIWLWERPRLNLGLSAFSLPLTPPSSALGTLLENIGGL